MALRAWLKRCQQQAKMPAGSAWLLRARAGECAYGTETAASSANSGSCACRPSMSESSKRLFLPACSLADSHAQNEGPLN